MSSVIFAMAVIIVIALMNLFLGFSAALLLGRGPRNWSEVDNVLEIRYFSPRLPLPFRRRVSDAGSSPARDAAGTESAHEKVAGTSPDSSKPPHRVSPRAERASQSATRPCPAAVRRVAGKIVLNVKKPNLTASGLPPEECLQEQLHAWRQGEVRAERPSASMVTVIPQEDLDARRASLLADAVQSRIASPLRNDRCVLRVDDHCFAWFSRDVAPEDALMPIERIRHQIVHTRFEHDGETVTVDVKAAIGVVLPTDTAPDVFSRLHAAMDLAQLQVTSVTVIDAGSGPRLADPIEIDAQETSCVLDPAVH
jgi:hypothetical protein